jgi:hypothetical protein
MAGMADWRRRRCGGKCGACEEELETLEALEVLGT